ncbi:PPE family protein [Candidatus Mycobacterium methanotrophicum]
MDFGALPPEINSARMYSGAGSGPMLVAAAAWDTLAAELSSTAARYGSAITELTSGQWRGPSSMSMAAAAAPYVAWLQATAAQAEQTAAQAKDAAAAYELAFAMTVPPPVIAANRSQLMVLVATNFFGQNTPAIAATEAHYVQMWIQDAVAMYGYAGSSAAAARLNPFSQPPPTTDPAGLTAQSATVAHAVASSAGSQPTALTQLTSTPPALGQLAAPAADPPGLSSIISFLMSPEVGFVVDLYLWGINTPRITNMGIGWGGSSVASGRSILITNERVAFQRQGDAKKLPGFEPITAGWTSPGMPGGTAVSAGMGRASPLGSLSVPPSWVGAVPEVRPVALALPDSGATVTAEASGQMPQVPGSSFSQAVLGTLSRDVAPPRQPKTRPIIVRSPAAG